MNAVRIAQAALVLGSLLVPAALAQGGNAKVVSYISSLPKQTVDAQEKADLVWMREEEKLARDVYQALHMIWKLPAFANIAKSEQSHMDLVKVALDRYGIADPIRDDRIGEFASPVLKSLFNTLVIFGLNSLAHAELVGAFIEDLDISDLRGAMTRTDNRDLDTVYQNLCLGSRNHMRAFYGLLQAQNLTYPGIVLPSAEIQKIVNAAHEFGGVDENGLPLP